MSTTQPPPQISIVPPVVTAEDWKSVQSLVSSHSREISKLQEDARPRSVFDLQADNATAVDLAAALEDLRTKMLLNAKGTDYFTDSANPEASYNLYVVPHTCQEYFDRGIQSSGFYDIDPDGFNYGLVPIRVFCYVEGGTIRKGLITHV